MGGDEGGIEIGIYSSEKHTTKGIVRLQHSPAQCKALYTLYFRNGQQPVAQRIRNLNWMRLCAVEALIVHYLNMPYQ